MVEFAETTGEFCFNEGSGGGRSEHYIKAELPCDFSKFSQADFPLLHFNPTRARSAPTLPNQNWGGKRNPESQL